MKPSDYHGIALWDKQLGRKKRYTEKEQAHAVETRAPIDAIYCGGGGNWNIEVTDVFCGQANYCWVLRGTTKAKTRRGRIEAAKQLAGWTGWVRVQVTDFGDMLEIRPTPGSGVCQVAFVTWSDTP